MWPNPDFKNFDAKKIIRKIASILRADRNFRDVMAVTGAKVPIVKFYHRGYRLDGDVSLYNVLVTDLSIGFENLWFLTLQMYI